jgi:hypothetical protein
MDGLTLFLTDESNLDGSESHQFFVYGGIFIDVERVGALCRRVEEIRSNYGYVETDVFKCAVSSRPNQVSQEDFNRSKQDLIDACFVLGARFIVNITSKRMVAKQKDSQVVSWAADYALGRFHYYLLDNDRLGMVLMDTLPFQGPKKYLVDKFGIGLNLEASKETRKLNKIISYSFSVAGSSHLASVGDIVLGTFRYCLNNIGGEVCARVFKHVGRLIWGTRPPDGKDTYLGYGLIIRPNRERLSKDEVEILDRLIVLIEESKDFND